MKISFIIAVFAIIMSMNAYVAIRGWQALPPVSFLRPIYIFVLIILFLALLIGLIFGSSMSHDLGKVISQIGFTYMIIFIYLFISFLIVDVVRIINSFVHFGPVGLIQFRFWAFLSVSLLIGIALIIGNFRFNHPQIVKLNLTVDKPLHNKVLKIVAASDIHLGVTIDKKNLSGYVDLINNQHPDIVLLVGDVSDRSIKPLIEQNMDEELRRIKAPLGVYAINGNHEFYAETPHATADYISKAGIHELRDQMVLVDSSFYVIGRDDRTNRKRIDLKTIMKGVDKSKPVILMDHQPWKLEEAEQNGVDLQLSGHTHNGQFFPGNLFVKRMYELGYGYMKKGKTNYYVSSGLGLWGPQYRIGTQSELVVINLKY